jgi:hypothetical protein
MERRFMEFDEVKSGWEEVDLDDALINIERNLCDLESTDISLDKKRHLLDIAKFAFVGYLSLRRGK